MEYGKALEILTRNRQEHVLRYFDKLTEAKQQELLSSVDKIDFNILSAVDLNDERKVGTVAPGEVLSIKEVKKNKTRYEEIGLRAIRQGKVAAVILAGGQGTRLGIDAPKGTFNMGENKELSIFACLMNNLLSVTKKAGTLIELFIMTSEATDVATRVFFQTHDYFGYDKKRVHFFMQGVAPAISFDGKILMEEKHRPVFSPDGNGGWFAAFMKAGMGRVLLKEGIEWLNVFSVDNVLQKICDPVFVGATIKSGAMSGAKVVKKHLPEEKVGILCTEDGQPSIIEYYEMPEKLRVRHEINGELTYRYGVILNYLFNVEKLKEINRKKLPYHLAKKKINCIKGGKKFEPEEPNGYKIETLVLDMIKLSGSCVGVEVDREKEFAPVKNMHGEDSVDTAREALKANGVKL